MVCCPKKSITCTRWKGPFSPTTGIHSIPIKRNRKYLYMNRPQIAIQKMKKLYQIGDGRQSNVAEQSDSDNIKHQRMWLLKKKKFKHI